jgi:hypothetical protein
MKYPPGNHSYTSVALKFAGESPVISPSVVHSPTKAFRCASSAVAALTSLLIEIVFL